LTHIDSRGAMHMVDVAPKPATHRVAVAEAWVAMSAAARRSLASGAAKKGDVLAAARLAGIMAAKRTSELIPLCHPLPLTHVAVDLEPSAGGVRVRARAETFGPTGVEMEAMTAASVAALTLYDMLKAVDRAMTIERVQLVEKSGGKSGTFTRQSPRPARALRRKRGQGRRRP
jgi:cyclic pyranopterin monophosphate synthase